MKYFSYLSALATVAFFTSNPLTAYDDDIFSIKPVNEQYAPAEKNCAYIVFEKTRLPEITHLPNVTIYSIKDHTNCVVHLNKVNIPKTIKQTYHEPISCSNYAGKITLVETVWLYDTLEKSKEITMGTAFLDINNVKTVVGSDSDLKCVIFIPKIIKEITGNQETIVNNNISETEKELTDDLTQAIKTGWEKNRSKSKKSSNGIMFSTLNDKTVIALDNSEKETAVIGTDAFYLSTVFLLKTLLKFLQNK